MNRNGCVSECNLALALSELGYHPVNYDSGDKEDVDNGWMVGLIDR